MRVHVEWNHRPYWIQLPKEFSNKELIPALEYAAEQVGDSSHRVKIPGPEGVEYEHLCLILCLKPKGLLESLASGGGGHSFYYVATNTLYEDNEDMRRDLGFQAWYGKLSDFQNPKVARIDLRRETKVAKRITGFLDEVVQAMVEYRTLPSEQVS